MRGVALVLAALALTGCGYRDDGKRPEVELPATLGTAMQSASVWPDTEWWRRFGSAELDSLIAGARARNHELAAAVARVRQAQAVARVARALILPALGVEAAASGQNVNDQTGASGGLFPEGTLRASYEIDFWGRNSANTAAAAAAVAASRYDRETVALTIVSDVAIRYFQARAARARLVVAHDNMATAQAVLAQVEARIRAGTALARELAQQRALVAMQAAALPPLQQAESDALAALAVLLGRPAQGFSITGTGLGSIVPAAVAPGLPSGLLMRRPDIAAAEAQLAAARADVAAARAAMFPRIALTGMAGVQSAALSSVTGGTSFLYALAAGLTQPIFDNGALAGRLDQAKARQDELTANYRAAVIAAFADVQKALQAVSNLARQQAAQELVVAESRRAFALSSTQYRAGAEDMLTVLDTQRVLYAAQDQLEQTRLARLQALVGLYKALGGGWQAGT
jgi:NodT family efflux transporter outer membrane factor (OMF) lipoprotein